MSNARRRTLPRLGAVSLLVAAALVLTSCLRPDEYDPTGNEPIGKLEVIKAMGTAVRVKGWAIDPNTTASVNVKVAYLGLNVAVAANLNRPDVASAYPGYGAAHGFDFTTPSLGSGVGQVCVWVENVGAGSRGRLLGCHDIPLKSDDAVGRLESVVATSPTSVKVTGWAVDPKTEDSSWILWSLNGSAWTYYPAKAPRPEINQFFGIDGHHGFAFDLPVTKGTNTLCVKIAAYLRGNSVDLGCSTSKFESLSPVATGLDLRSIFWVKPPSGHALENISRDAGVSATLSDGSVMWFFGDSGGYGPDGRLSYFVNNTAAWSSASNPTGTLDVVRGDRVEPYQSMSPTEPFNAPCPSNWKPVIWPSSAVTVPQSSTVDRVLVYFGNVCLGGEMLFADRGMGVAEFTYDRTASAATTPVIGRIVTQTLFSGNLHYGNAAHYDGTHVYAYQCQTPANDGQIHWPNDPGYGPCTVARVSPGDIGDVNDYRYRATGGTWSANPADAIAMTVPSRFGSAPDQDKQLPPAAFTITNDPVHGYLMVYTPWPGLSGHVMVRRATSPVGPWSEPFEYQMPGCNDYAQGEGKFCYAATAQPSLSRPGFIGIGFYDQLVGLSPPRGGYLAGTVDRRW